MEWLLAPIDPTRAHDVGFYVSWHARLMVLGWAFLFPAGILAARFFKIMPGQNWPAELDNQVWWITHLSSQYVGGIVVLFGVVLIFFGGASGAGLWHAVLGWTAISICGLQFLSGWARGSKGGPTAPSADGSERGDHFDMSSRRRAFEYYHKFVGYAGLLISWLAILTGLWIANAPVWMWVSIVTWWILLVVVFAALQSRGRCHDTYQAIWGDDPKLPGLQRPPIGIGVRRK